MELTLDRMKLLMVYDNLLTLTENIEKSKKPLLSEQKSSISLILKTLKSSLAVDKAFFNTLKTESSFFRRFNSADEMLRELESIKNGTSSIPTRDLKIAIKQISKNVPEFAADLERQLVSSKKFKEVASKVYPNGPSGSPNMVNRKKILDGYEQLGLNPDRMDDLLKRNAKIVTTSTNTSKIVRGLITTYNTLGEGILQAWRAPSLFKAIFNFRKVMPNSNTKGWQIFLRWLFTGTTRNTIKGFREVFDVLVKNGISKDLAKILAVKVVSVGAEVAMRWVTINGAIFALNMYMVYRDEAGTDEERKRRDVEFQELVFSDFSSYWGQVGFRWVWPVGTVAPAIGKILEGIFRRNTPSEVFEKLKSGTLPEQKEKEELDNKIENAKQDSKLDDLIDDSESFIGEKGLQVFLKTKGKEYEPNSFKPKEGEYPAEGMDTEGNLYYFENNKWSIVE